MANTGELNLKLLQRATPRDQALHLRHVLDSNPAAVSSLTSQLISLVAAEVLPPMVLCLWPSVSNQPEVIVAVIRQELCVNAHHSAIKHFYRHLRREKTFAEAWEAVGGAQGIAQLAAKLSVYDVRFLLGVLGDTARAQGARKQRQREMEQLLELLWGQTEDNRERVAFDRRPLREAYARLLPACGPAFRVEWEENEKRQLQMRYDASVETDYDFFERHYDDKLGRNEFTGYTFLTKVEPLVLHRTEYGLQVLERLLDSENLLGASPDTLLDAVVDPLGKRLLSKRRISDGITQRFWARVVQGLEERSAFRRSFVKSEYHYHKMVTRLVEVWNHSRARAEYTEMLATLFTLLPEAKVNRCSIPNLLRSVGESRRYQLLRLFLKNTAGNRLDIGEPTSLEHSELEQSSLRWQSEVFFLLPAEQALNLWEKVQRAGQDVGRNDSHGRLRLEGGDPERRDVADGHVVRALLLNQIGSSAVSAFSHAELEAMRAEARQEVSRRMRKASQGRSADDRLQAALSALTLCVAIGDLELYAETLRWARRFNRDPMTVKELYRRHCSMTKEGDDLLAVLHEKKKDKVLGIAVDELAQKIHSANAVLTMLYETAGMGVNERSFSPSDWEQTFKLIQRVVGLRLNRVNDFQLRTNMSDDSLYEVVWKPTYVMLEKMLSDLFGPAGDCFASITPYATLSTLRVTEPQKLHGHTVRFLDRLAEFQDSLWAEVRRRETPALVIADEIWPKGATLQQLSSYFGEALAYLPYTQARIEAVVFMNPLKALRPIELDEEAQLAIGTFVDSWPRALQLYVQMPGEERKERIRRAWRQATVVFSKDRMSPEEAERFWWPVFQGIGVEPSEVGIDEKEDQRREPSLPDVDEDEDMQPLEWNPDPEYDQLSQPERSRALTPTLLDVLLSRPTEDSTARLIKAQSSIFGDVKAVIPGKPRPCSLWSSFFDSSKRRLSGRSADAYAAAAILAVNMRHGSDTSLLKTPFPNAKTVRIPAVYLDQEFLERVTDNDVYWYGFDVLAAVSHYAPSRLLVQLAESVFETIRRKPETERPYMGFADIVKFILNGRDPSLAIPLIQQFVLENPDASSWHRPVLNSGRLEKLSPGDGKRFFESFTDIILDKLQEQVERRRADEEARDNAAAKKAPLVKITTVKMLSQLLRESPVVDPSLAVDLNIRILKRASHVDIRTASVKGLTEAIANSTTSSVVKKRVFDALREYAVPIASSINESRPFTDWDALTPDDDLPEIWEEGSGFQTVPPIMSLILEAGRGMDWKTDEGRALKEITYSMLDASAETNKRWMSLFLKKNGFSLPNGAQLPATPLFPTSLESLLPIMMAETSDRYADLAMGYLLLRTNPPEWLTAITQAVRDNKKLAYTNAGKHWLQMWNSDGDMFLKRLFLRIQSYLSTVERGVERGEIQKRQGHQSMDSYLFDISDAVLMRGELAKFEALMEDTSTFDRDSPVWGRIVERIDELRTPAWQADPNRKPAVLPETLGLKIRMLDLPRLSPSTPDEAKEVAARCAKGAVKLLEEIVADQRPYIRSFSTLQKALEDAEPKAELGIAIAATPALDDASVVTLVDYLRVELAAGLLDKGGVFKKGFGKPHEEDVVRRATEVVMKMSGSRVEEFRTLAAGLRMDIENTDGWGWWS